MSYGFLGFVRNSPELQHSKVLPLRTAISNVCCLRDDVLDAEVVVNIRTVVGHLEWRVARCSSMAVTVPVPQLVPVKPQQGR